MYNCFTYVKRTVYNISGDANLQSQKPKDWIKTKIVKLGSVLTDDLASFQWSDVLSFFRIINHDKANNKNLQNLQNKKIKEIYLNKKMQRKRNSIQYYTSIHVIKWIV